MLRKQYTVWGIHVVNPEEEKGRAAVGRICRKGFKSGMKE